jgi:hypothetical protein
MPCATCGSASRAVAPSGQNYFNRQQSQAAQIVATGPCDYTVDVLKVWAEKLTCFKQKGLYVSYNVRPADLNRALGDVLSAINYPTFPCYYQKELDRAQTIINIVISSEQC